MLRVGPVRVVESCHERSATRVPAHAEERGGDDSETLVFEARAPRSVAEVVFRKPTLEATAEVRGIVHLGRRGPRLEATLTWKVLHGPALALPIDLPAGWLPDQVQILGLDEPTAWHVEWRDDGGPRVVVQPPAYLDLANPIQVAVTASATGWNGPLEVPRVRPVGARVSDELWLAHGESGGEIRPIEAWGLVWVEPSMVAVESGRTAPGASPPAPSLAWRMDRAGRTAPDRTRGAVPEAGRGIVDGSESRSGTASTGLVRGSLRRAAGPAVDHVAVNGPLEVTPQWHVLGDEIGPPLAFRPREGEVGDAERTRRGNWICRPRRSGAAGAAREDGTAVVGSGQAAVASLADLGGGPGGGLDLRGPLAPSDRDHGGLLRSDRNALKRAFATLVPNRPAGRRAASTRRLAHAFEFGASSGRLELRTEPLRRAASDGVILEARLAGPAVSIEKGQQRLVLQVVPGTSRRLEVRLPAEASLVRASSGGRAVVPIWEGEALGFALPMSSASRPFSELVLEYEVAGGDIRAGEKPGWPQFSLPCLAFTWEILLPRTREVVRIEPTMTATDPAKGAILARPGPFFGPWPGLGDSDEARHVASILRDLQDRFRQIGATDSTLGEWLTRLDAGRWPLVIDRDRAGDGRDRPGDPAGPGQRGDWSAPTARRDAGEAGSAGLAARRRGPDHDAERRAGAGGGRGGRSGGVGGGRSGWRRRGVTMRRTGSSPSPTGVGARPPSRPGRLPLAGTRRGLAGRPLGCGGPTGRLGRRPRSGRCDRVVAGWTAALLSLALSLPCGGSGRGPGPSVSPG